MTAKETHEQQMADEELKEIIDNLQGPTVNELRQRRWSKRGYILEGEVLYRFAPYSDAEEPQLVVPKNEVLKVLYENHDFLLPGHYRVEKTIKRIQQRYFWPTLCRDVTKHIRNCVDCQKYKPTNLKLAGFLQTPVMARRFEVLAVDLFGPLPPADTGERWIFG